MKEERDDIVFYGAKRPDTSCEWQYSFDLGVRFNDVNGDGLSDAIVSADYSWTTDEKKVYINNGKEFIQIENRKANIDEIKRKYFKILFSLSLLARRVIKNET